MPKKILYIEDNPDNMTLVKRAIESSNDYEFLWAVNGVQGIDMAESQEPDLILLDINLPDIDGYEIARRMRNSARNFLAYVPIIALTANSIRGDAEKALAAGCDAYIAKPINVRELFARIEGFLSKS